MTKLKLRGKDLKKIGYPEATSIGLAMQIMHKHYKRTSKEEALTLLKEIMDTPENFKDHEILSPIAHEFIEVEKVIQYEETLLDRSLPYKMYGGKEIDDTAKIQMDLAMKLPIVKAGALMADAHTGYGLPIGGVLATENTIIPYGVGVDIGCRMCLTLYNIPIKYLKKHNHKLKFMLREHTRFGMRQVFEDADVDHPIFERNEFREIPFVRDLKDKAYSQIGTSGGGNHFVEFGEVELLENNEFGLPAGSYVGILSHSGSRGMGARIAQHYTRIAMSKCLLPKSAKNLAWLDLNSEEGQEYWLAMNLAGDYASACHHDIHKRLSKALGEKPVFMVENHHNFAWKEKLADGTNVIVHRKGATPAGKGVLGIIPGSMTAPGYIIKGKGSIESINSASHGAGRQMSRRRAKESLTQSFVKKYLKEHGITLIGGGLDEAPQAYKDITKVMNYQKELVEVLGKFTPKIVRMAKDE